MAAIEPGGIETIRPDDVLVVAGEWDRLENLSTRIQQNQPTK
jgi:K+/H+ antiporter YhaU regulatory subunit KhtT